MSKSISITILTLLSCAGLSITWTPSYSKMIVTYPKLDPSVKPDTIEALEFCVKISSSRDARMSCIGSTVRYCINHINDAGETDSNNSECQYRESILWDHMLNAQYSRLMAGLANKQPEKEKLRSAQQGWIKLRDGYCNLVGDMGGSSAYVASNINACELRMTATQYLNLVALQEDLEL